MTSYMHIDTNALEFIGKKNPLQNFNYTEEHKIVSIQKNVNPLKNQNF